MTRTEQVAAVVAEEWCEMLGLPDPAAGDDFFAEGGDSLMAITLITRVERRLGIAFPVEAMFLDGSYDAVLEACVHCVAELPGTPG